MAALLAACGGSQGTNPDDMSAEEHRRAAATEEEEAAEHEAEYDPDARSTMGTANAPTSESFYGPDLYNPTEVHLAEAQRHEDLAEEHRAAAEALEAYEEQECARFPPATRAACPLLGQLESVEDVEGGVRLRFAEGVPLDAVADHMRCHVAYARTRGREGMEHCPLYVEGAAVGTDDGAVTLTTDAGEEAVAELRARARAHLR
jgi:hypothetical protein